MLLDVIVMACVSCHFKQLFFNPEGRNRDSTQGGKAPSNLNFAEFAGPVECVERQLLGEGFWWSATFFTTPLARGKQLGRAPESPVCSSCKSEQVKLRAATPTKSSDLTL